MVEHRISFRNLGLVWSGDATGVVGGGTLPPPDLPDFLGFKPEP